MLKGVYFSIALSSKKLEFINVGMIANLLIWE